MTRFFSAVLLVVALASGCATPSRENPFVASWAVGHIQPMSDKVLQYNNQTLREIVRLSAGGEQVRVRIANTFGSSTLIIGEAHVALRDSGSRIVPGSDRVLTFSGQRAIAVPPGAPVLSELAVSLWLPNPTALETSTFLQGASFVSQLPGNHAGAVDLPSPQALAAWPFVSGVNVSASGNGASIVALADSATRTSEWPRLLGERLQADPATRHLGVVSVAVSGNRMLHNSASPGGPSSPNPQWGQSLLTRFDRDVLGQAGVAHVIVFIGLNDIAGPGGFYPASEAITVEDLIAGYRQLIARAREKGLTIQACTLPPLQGNTSLKGYDTPANEARRVAFNQWIRSSGEFDGVIDVDLLLRDPKQPARLLPAYDNGDRLHPNTAGGRVIANAIDLKPFLK
jgi:lysophospholipase L1-like esterase